MTLRRIFISVDFLLAASASILFSYWLPDPVPNELVKDYDGVGITVLSIVFSIFIAALAVIIASSDDDFVSFLEEEGLYTAILQSYQFTLGLLFCALMYSLASYAYTAKRLTEGVHAQWQGFVSMFCFLFLWSLVAAFASTWDAMKYATYRRRFMSADRKPKCTGPPLA